MDLVKVAVLLLGLWLTKVAFGQQRVGTEDVRQPLFERVRQSVKFPTSAICPDRQVPAYYLTAGKSLLADWGSLVYLGVSERQCLAMCSDNKDLKGSLLLCSSFIYHPNTLNCTVSRQMAQPRGERQLVDDDGAIYYEKFCLPPSAPVECGEAMFIRYPKAVLVGHAMKAIKQDTLENCTALCINHTKPQCKSAMYYSKDKECILNGESAATREDIFAEDNEMVEYIENGCVEENKAKALMRKKPIDMEDQQAPVVALPVIKANQEVKKGEKNTQTTVVAVDDDDSMYTPWSEWSGCSGTERARIRSCVRAGRCTGRLIERATCPSWSEWTVCFPFPFIPGLEDPCVGFQRRDCIGEPTMCTGERFRYCILPGCVRPGDFSQGSHKTH